MRKQKERLLSEKRIIRFQGYLRSEVLAIFESMQSVLREDIIELIDD
jgi:hypothetical protein